MPSKRVRRSGKCPQDGGGGRHRRGRFPKHITKNARRGVFTVQRTVHPFNGDVSVKANAGNYDDVETAVMVDQLLSRRLLQLGHAFRGEDDDGDGGAVPPEAARNVDLCNKVDKCAMNFHFRQSHCEPEELPAGRHQLPVAVCTSMIPLGGILAGA